MARALTFAAMLLSTLAAGCETDSDWISASPGQIGYLPSQMYFPVCEHNGSEWTRLHFAPPGVEQYLRHTEAAVPPKPGAYVDTWYRRNWGEVMLCRNVRDSEQGGYSAFWRFREQDGEVVVAESYAWQVVIVN